MMATPTMTILTAALTSVALSAATLGAQASPEAPSSKPLRLSVEDYLNGAGQNGDRTARQVSGSADVYGRSLNLLSLDDLGVNPTLRLEFGQATLRPIDVGIAADGMSATQRAEAGLIDDTQRLYDAALRLDAATVGDVSLVFRGGVRTVTGGTQTDLAPANGAGELTWAPVAGVGLEWRPRRDFWVGGSTLVNVDERGGALAEVIAELGVELNRGMSISLGFRTLESRYNPPSDAAEDLQDAAFAAIRLRF